MMLIHSNNANATNSYELFKSLVGSIDPKYLHLFVDWYY